MGMDQSAVISSEISKSPASLIQNPRKSPFLNVLIEWREAPDFCLACRMTSGRISTDLLTLSGKARSSWVSGPVGCLRVGRPFGVNFSSGLSALLQALEIVCDCQNFRSTANIFCALLHDSSIYSSQYDS
jgi:hypothetical protein